MKAAKKIGIMVLHDEFNSYEFLTQALGQIFGYDTSQAANCAHIIYERGNYVVKTLNRKDLVKAGFYVDILEENQIPAKIIPL